MLRKAKRRTISIDDSIGKIAMIAIAMEIWNSTYAVDASMFVVEADSFQTHARRLNAVRRVLNSCRTQAVDGQAVNAQISH